MVEPPTPLKTVEVEVLAVSHELAPFEPGEPGSERRSPHANKRSAWQRESDLLDIAEMMLRRVPTETIKNRLNAVEGKPYQLSLSQVRYDCREVHRRWQEEFIGGTMRQRKAAELAFLDRLEREAWEVYERSKRDESKGSQTTSGTQADLEIGSGGGRSRSVNVTKMVSKAQRDGDVGPLLLLYKISEHRSRLLGLEQPIELAGDGDDGMKQKRLEVLRRAFREKVLDEEAERVAEEKRLQTTVTIVDLQPCPTNTSPTTASSS